MRERPILFSGAMVLAILAGKKTVTRRLFKGEIADHPQEPRLRVALIGTKSFWLNSQVEHPNHVSKASPYGVAGARLWVMETWALYSGDFERRYDGQVPAVRPEHCQVVYAADHIDPRGDGPDHPVKWRPSIFMPRWASRITLEITDVRVERLQDITEEDARAESVGSCGPGGDCNCDTKRFAKLWDQINGKRAAWDSNPWVWRVAFKRIEQSAGAA